MLGNLNGWHLVIILAVVLLLFGAPKLPGLARSVGQSMRIFRSEVKTMKDETASEQPAQSSSKESSEDASASDGIDSNSPKPKS
jgi:sec-independent protein translocase protein TatA